MKTKHTVRKSKPQAEAKGCVLATFKGEQACIDQTQPKWATLGRERNNTPADDLSSPLLCKPEANPRRGNAAGPDRHSCGTLIPNIVEENMTPKSVSSTAEQGSNPQKATLLSQGQGSPISVSTTTPHQTFNLLARASLPGLKAGVS